MTAQRTAGLIVDSEMRSDFERWAVECGLSIKRHVDGLGSYVDSSTLWAWPAWQAGIARSNSHDSLLQQRDELAEALMRCESLLRFMRDSDEEVEGCAIEECALEARAALDRIDTQVKP